MARMEDEVKKTRQKWGRGDMDAKRFIGSLPPKGPKGTQWVAAGPHKGASKTFLLCSVPGSHLPGPVL